MTQEQRFISVSPDTALQPISAMTQHSTNFDDAFDGLYKVAFRVAYRLLGEQAAAEDVAQDTMTRAYARWWRLRTDPERWISRVAANRAIDHWRRTKREDLTPAQLERAHRGEPVLERLALVDALSRLSRRQREVVVLRYLAGYGEADVAAILNCSVGTVKTHASRGLTALRADSVLEY